MSVLQPALMQQAGPQRMHSMAANYNGEHLPKSVVAMNSWSLPYLLNKSPKLSMYQHRTHSWTLM